MTKNNYKQNRDGRMAGSYRSPVSPSEAPETPETEQHPHAGALHINPLEAQYEAYRGSLGETSGETPFGALIPLHATPSSLLKTDSEAWYPPEANPDIIRDLRSLDRRLVVLDIETTGLGETAQITEISWYSLNSGDGGTLIPAHTLEGADEKALEISRYHERLAGKPQDDGTQLAALKEFLGGDGAKVHLVGSNPAFDAAHLARLFEKRGLTQGRPPWQHRLIDPAAAAYFLSPDSPFGAPTGLAEASRECGVDITDHHAANADVRATALVWHELERRRRLLP